MADAMWDVLEGYEAEETGGGGIIGKILIEIGYKAFVPGVGNEDSFFAYKAGAEKSKTSAKTKCDSLLSKHGVTTRAQVCLQFRVYKKDVLGREVTWQGDRFFCHPLWTPAYKEVIKPALEKSGVDLNKIFGEVWGRIGFAPDPSGRTTENQQGETVPETVEHLVEVYADRAAAEAAVTEFAESGEGGGDSNPSGVVVPDGYTAETWLGLKDEITETLGDDPSKEEIGKVAEEYGATIPAVESLLQ